jgi:hypothetical protein
MPYWDPPIHATMLRCREWKLSIWHTAGEGEINGELYNMEQDPQELTNLWNRTDHARVRAELTEKMANWIASQEIRNGTRGGETIPSKKNKLTCARI